MDVTIVDYKSGNISSVINSFKEVAKDKVNIEVTSDLNKIKSSNKVVLPGQGSFKSCIDSLNDINGLVDTLSEFALTNKKPLLGICVGLQMFAEIGYEEVETKGLGWISGKVSKIDNKNGKYKLPHIGWNQIEIIKDSIEYRYYTNELEGKPSELGEIEWLQNSILVDDFIITIDSNRTSFLIFSPDKGLYDLIPYNMDWAIQDMVCGTLTLEQKVLLQETSLSNG